ncbi:MAG TPA: TonB-dependent receptor [Rhodocyclaceae bacterium]|nr:TonB-dependent receptor [Rhodocyclaceae bacterium]
MFRFQTRRAHIACAATVGCIFSICFFSKAFADTMLDPVVVTATRFAEANSAAPTSVTVIDHDEIESSPGLTIVDVLKTRAGIDVRSLYGPLAVDASVDLRGFGETATSHTLVLLDGIRLNPIDLGSIAWDSIPLEHVQRIEIIRGGGSVLYGDRAVGGVINIITDKSGRKSASVITTLGSYGYKSAEADIAGQGPGYYQLNVKQGSTNGWRRNNETDQQIINAKVGHIYDAGHSWQLDASYFAQSYGLPSGISEDDFKNDPRKTDTPNDWAKHDGYRVRPSGAWVFSDTLRAEGEVGLEQIHSEFNNFGFRDNTVQTVSVTPRVKWQHGLGTLRSETVMGVDSYVSNLHTDIAGAPDTPIFDTVKVDQTSSALYANNQTWLTERWVTSAGVRWQRVEQTATDQASNEQLDNNHEKTIGELGLSGFLNSRWRVFGKVAQVFRFANTDELTTFSGLGSAVRPEQGTLVQSGTEWRNANMGTQLSVYDMKLTDEIAYNVVTMQNENLARTRHAGLEWDGDWRMSDAFALRAGYAFTRAVFRAGDDIGKNIPLVPRHHASAILTWKKDAWSASMTTNYVGARQFGSDTANVAPKLPPHTTADVLASYSWAHWKASAQIRNLFDKRYADTAFVNYYYPADGRELFVSLRYDM